MKLSFTKMHGAGNDFLLFDCMGGLPDDLPSLSRALCDRHRGVGADGVVLILPSERLDAKICIFNSDGSEAQTCGNALRCVGRLLYESSFARKSHIRIEAPSGERELFLTVRNGSVGKITVNMGVPRLMGGEVVKLNENAALEFRRLSLGNEHRVAFLDGIDGFDIQSLASPEVNTELCEVAERNHLRVRTVERGCGETLACGSGACAAAVVSIARGACDAGRLIKISMRGGELGVLVTRDGTAYLSGDAERAFEGEVDWDASRA